ncbi:RelA/SpoT family protein [uncultured Friedmanniella sp.]|uniref:RelA/SpoT family protein n=1 Tax=uncultured Friedmanniella sp. TaxID=335381 RepID=UPI0035CBEC19
MSDQGTAVRGSTEDADEGATPVALDSARVGQSVGVPGEQPRYGMRHRLARLGSAKQQTPVLEPLFRVIRANHAKADLGVVERAYRIAEQHHRGQLRKSGDAYITHPLAVTTILAELGMTETTLCAALLHDTVEDTEYTLAQLTRDFGEEVALLVDGCTKVDKIKYGESAKSDTIRKMVVAMSRDIRVLVIKLADRLHNMRTLHYLRPDKQSRIASETLEIFAPLAHRLGMNAIKWELEDLAFSTLHPKIYDEIVRLVAEAAPSRDEFLTGVVAQVTADLKAAKIKALVTGRPKHYYSIYQKMVVRGRDFSDIFDLVGLRVLVEENRDCYAALGILHVRWNPLPGRFKDYIAMPKFNMYQSLHTTVLGPEGKPVELQIRTEEMHRRAEFGVAAHWKYKEGAAPTANPGDAGELVWVRQLMDWQRESADPGEFLDALRFEINSTEVYAFTPKGDVMTLPQGSTPVDFAYAIHTEVGNRTIGARVNNRLVPLESVLANGDVVEIFTSKAENAGPSRDWLGFVASPRARNKIRHHFTRERREESVESGKEALARQMRKAGLPLQRLLTLEHLTAVAGYFKLPDVTALYAAVGENTVGAQAVVNRLISVEGGEDAAADETSEDRVVTGRRRRTAGSSGSESGIRVVGATDLWVKLAKCCTPVPGDDIMGFVTRGAGVSVHRTDCVNASSLRSEPERLIDVEWAPTAKSSFLVAIQVEALDRARLLSDITRTLSDQHVNILSAALNTTKDRICRAKFTFETADPTHLDHVLRAVRNVPEVFDVYRISQ